VLKLHVDTDLGGDMDDVCTLAMVLDWPGAELTAIATVAEHQGNRVGFARYVFEVAGRTVINVTSGMMKQGG
jgi:purine nucleosidase